MKFKMIVNSFTVQQNVQERLYFKEKVFYYKNEKNM